MKPISDILEARVSEALAAVGGAASPGIVKQTQDGRFGDYQANGVMGLAKRLKRKPRELAQAVVEQLDVGDMCEEPAIAGPGFINFRLRADWLAGRLAEAIADEERLGIDPQEEGPKTVVDFSGPNIAKQMHVGHLRSTIIGDVIARVLEFWYADPAKVVRQNHVGDWGTQFGRVILSVWHICMSKHRDNSNEKPYYERELAELKRIKEQGENPRSIIERIKDRQESDWRYDSNCEEVDGEKQFKPFIENELRQVTWEQILDAYQYVNLIDELAGDLGFTTSTRRGGEIVEIPYESLSSHIAFMLQRGWEQDQQELLVWKYVREKSIEDCQEVYGQLGAQLTRKDVRGESFYNDRLGAVIEDLSGTGLLEESEGAQCVFMEGFKTKEGEPLPLIVRKSDGAYLYATTDLAAIRYRVDELGAARIIYVTDSRQKLHFDMVFGCARQAGWAGEAVQLEHVPFGSVLGPDCRPLKTREGENIKLKDLLSEAESRALQIVQDKNPDLSDEQKRRIARAVGIGAVKYADLSSNLVADYVFDWDKMLAMEGNTAPYMQYAYARVQSIFRKGGIDPAALLGGEASLLLEASEEYELAKRLLRYSETVESVARDLRPHLLTSYLFELAQAFSSFYTNCPVLKATGDTRATRLLLCYQTARTLRHGLGMLGIETIEQM